MAKKKQPKIRPRRKHTGPMPRWLVRTIWIVGIVMFLTLIWEMAFLFPSTSEPDAPGGWIPTTPGSGWCTSTGIPGTPDGTLAHCPMPTAHP